MIATLARNALVEAKGAAVPAVGFVFARAKGVFAVQSIHSAASGASRASAQQFKALYKTSDKQSAARVVCQSSRCIHEA